jgi:hypothetical protein
MLPATASAVPFQARATDGRLTIGTAGSIQDQDIARPGRPIVIDGDVNPVTGAITVPQSGFTFPSVRFTSPFPGSLTASAAAPATGSLEFSTGALTLDTRLTAVIQVDGSPGTCTISPIALRLTTGTLAAPARYRQGTPYNVRAGTFKVVGFQPSVPASGGAAICPTLNAAVGLPGPGSVELSNEGAPELRVSFKPRRRVVEKGDEAKFKVRTANSGGAASKVKTCVAVGKGLKIEFEGGGKRNGRRLCFADGPLASGATASHRFSVIAQHTAKVKGIASAGAAKARASARVEVE